MPVTFDIQGDSLPDLPATAIDDVTLVKNPKALFLRWHHRLGHPPAAKIQQMARDGHLPKQLATCDIPICTACMYGKATKKPWHVKGDSKSIPQTITRPGQCVSVDQLQSPTPGLIAQLRGTPTTKCYRNATVFLDHYSGLSYVHLQKSTDAQETVEGKKVFKAYCASHDVRVTHYHADNGIFANNLWRESIATNQQTLSFCGVNAHFQNGRTERRICELQDTARTSLIHVNH